jgi:CRISPR-associated protein Csm5
MARKLYTITPLTGIHIGTGDELTFLDYKIASIVGEVDFKKPMFFKFSSDRILQRLLDNEQAMTAFERASVNGNMRELQKFFQDNCVNIKDTDYPCEITKQFLKTYNENLNKDPHLNAAKVLQMYRAQGTPYPVIPGSSLKGSIRTALLNKYLDDLSDGDYEYLHKNFEQARDIDRENIVLQQKLLDYSNAKNDPLRAVAIPDCSFKDNGTQLVGGLKLVSLRLDPLETQIQAEVIKGELLGGSAVSELCISIDDKLQKTPFSLRWKDSLKCLKTITFDDIHKSCNDFYWDEFKKEYDKFYKNVNDGTTELIVKLKNRLEEAMTKGQFIIRVGRWSQVEFVTLEKNFRKPKTKKDKFGKPIGYGKTRTLFNYDGKYLPMGWCALSVKEE